jgi:DNA-binding response OmpR family regulator
MPPVRRRFHDAPCVIIVEDDADARHIYSEYMRMRGWTVFSAGDGRAGLNKIMELRPDVVVLDLAMPKVDGWTVLRQLRASSMTAHIPVVVISAVVDARDAAMLIGADAYLAKPCPPDVLYVQLRALARLRGEAAI